MGHRLIDNRHGLIVDIRTTDATGRAERDAAEAVIQGAARDCPAMPGRMMRRIMWPGCERSVIDGRTTRHPGYAFSRCLRKRVEEPFGWRCRERPLAGEAFQLRQADGSP